MRSAGEFIGMMLFIGICIWISVVFWVPRLEKPIAACKPVAIVANQVRDLFVAIAPGSMVDQMANGASRKVASGCLAYTGNLFAVTRTE